MRNPLARLMIFLALVAVVCSLGVSYRSNVAWKEVLETGVTLEARLEARSSTRPVLYGEAREGCAFDEYGRAIGLLSPTAYEEWLALRKAQRASDESAERLRDELVDEHSEMLAALAHGAHLEDGRYPADGGDHFGGAPKLLSGRLMVNIAVLAAEEHVDQGRPEAAARVLLDAMQFSSDMMRVPQLISTMIGDALLSITAHGALIEGRLLDRFPPTQLELLDCGLGRLDRGLTSTGPGWDGELLLFIRSAVEADSLARGPRVSLKQWRYGFSERLMCAEYVRTGLELRELLDECEGLAWPEVREQLDGFAADASRNSPARSWGIARGVEQTHRGVRTRLRISRSAIRYRLTGTASVLSDPFGDELAIVQDGSHLVIESCGPGGRIPGDRYKLALTLNGR